MFFAPQEVLRFVITPAGRVHDAVIVTGGACLLQGYLCDSATHGISLSFAKRRIPVLSKTKPRASFLLYVVFFTDQVPA